MFRRRQLFLLLGVVRVPQPVQAALQDLERAARDALDSAGQRAIDVRVAPGELAGTVFCDIRFSGDHAGALAAFERWKTTLPDGSVVLRTLLRGPDIDLEWSDEEYDRALQARERSADPEPPASDPPPGQGSWLRDWQEAARHPWKTRLFMIGGFALLGVVFAPLTGHSAPVSLAVAAAIGAVIGAAMGEYAMRRLGG